MARKVVLSIAGRRCVAALREEEAPETCRKIWEALPARSLASHAKFAGDEIIVMLPVMTAEENQLKDVGAGDVGYYPMQQTLCFFYGALQPFGYVNVVAKVVDGLDALRDAGALILEQGVQPAELARLEDGGRKP